MGGSLTFFIACRKIRTEQILVQTAVDEELREEFSAIAEGVGCSLLECEFKGGTLRLTIDHDEGVSHDHCQMVSKQISALLDISDFGSGKYFLEVSSPGLDRKFYAESDYERFVGQLIKVTWKTPEMEHKQTITGRLDSYSVEGWEIVLKDSSGADAHTISLNDIELARLEPEI